MKYDIAIIGGGPAGLSAAITASSKGRKVVVFEAHGFPVCAVSSLSQIIWAVPIFPAMS
jgi:flavin-dependent dehydrogenase